MQSLTDIPLAYHALIAAGILAAFYLLSRPARSILSFIGKKVITRTETVPDDRILDVLMANVRPAMLLLGLEVAVRKIYKGVLPSHHTILQVLEYTRAALFILVVIREVVNDIALALPQRIVHRRDDA